MKCVTNIEESLQGKYVLVRAGLDVPLDAHGEVEDDFRVTRALPTLRFLRERGARTIILSHIGRDPRTTNESVARALRAHIPVTYVPDLFGPVAHAARAAMRDGDTLMLENLRCDEREEKNDETFARELATYGDMYINDAFSVSHRTHASVVALAGLLPHFGGILLCEEIAKLSSARTPAQPSFAILGGAKFETKAPLIQLLLDRYDHLLIAGALANDVFKAQGLPVGISLVSQEPPEQSILAHPHFIAPTDITVERRDGQACVKKPRDVGVEERIVDVGPDTITAIAPYVASAKTVLWNGPTGLYEHGFIHYTHSLYELIVKSSSAAIIGGGDTIAAIQESGIEVPDHIFLSTGGGAMLDYLLQGSLPGIDALH